MGAMQRLLHMVYPPQCASCGDVVGDEAGLCAKCWRDTPFIIGETCAQCGTPLMGEADAAGAVLRCDDCLRVARPWSKGRAALLYHENGRRLVLALKHGDRTEIAPQAARWMAARLGDVITPDMLALPIPLHWSRLLKRRYNQSALLAQALAEHMQIAWHPDALLRTKATPSMEGKTREGRFANVIGAIGAHPKRGAVIKGRPVLLVDDVMTSGATFAAAAEACHSMGAKDVCVVALARVAKDV